MEKSKNKNIIQSSFFLKLFSIPTIIWLIISLISMIPDDVDSDYITWQEMIIGDTIIFLIWFIISFVIALIFNEMKNTKHKTKVIKEVHYVAESQESIDNTSTKISIDKYPNYKFIKNGMIILFILTIISLWGAGISVLLINRIKPQPGFSFIKNMWVFWCWLPISLLSIILGFKYKAAGFKCVKNIVGGFIIGALLLLYGSFCLLPTFSEDYNKINVYKNIIDAKIPKNGELEIQNFKTTYNKDLTEYTIIKAYYRNEDIDKLVESIENNNNWNLGKNMKSTLQIFIPSQIQDENSYFSIYNKTTNQYNTLPDTSGDYEIYTMKYDKFDMILEIHKFKYSYKDDFK